jgi:hypothetical protein
MTITVLIVVGACVAVLRQILVAQVMGRASRHWTSTSAADARRRGVLVGEPVVTTPVIQADSFQAAVTDAWVEEVTHLEYRFLFFKREVREGRYRLVAVVEPRTPLPSSSSLARFTPGTASAPGDTAVFPLYLSGETLHRPYLELERPFPDTLWFALILAGPPP